MKTRSGEKIKLMSVDELLGVSEGEPVSEIEIRKIYEFKNHPFKVKNDDKMKELIESIQINGILTPVIVRPDDEDGYEMISGHRRLFAAKQIGLAIIPATIKEMTEDEATIAMVDSNIQREEILPSEKAFAYKLRYEAMRRTAGRPSSKNASQVGTNLRSDVELAKQVGESRNQIHRYIRLTELKSELLDMVDDGRIALNTGVDISYIKEEVQEWLYDYVKDNGVIKSVQIAELRKQLDNNEDIAQIEMIQILNDCLPGKTTKDKVTLSAKKLRNYFPSSYSSSEMKNVILGLLEQWKNTQGGE